MTTLRRTLFAIAGFALLAGLPRAAEAEEKFFEIRAKKFSFTPNVIHVNKGDTVRIRLLSEDVHHGIYVDGYGIQTTAFPGKDGSLKFVADKPGRFIFRCSVTCGEFHPYMIGHLQVTPNTPLRWIVGIVMGMAVVAAVFAMTRTREEPAHG